MVTVSNKNIQDYFEWPGGSSGSSAVQSMVGLHVLLSVSLFLLLDFRHTVSWALVACPRALWLIYNMMSLGKSFQVEKESLRVSSW